MKTENLCVGSPGSIRYSVDDATTSDNKVERNDWDAPVRVR